MRQLLLAAGVACAAVGLGGRVLSQGTTMPGQVVGSGFSLPQAGNQIRKAAPQAGHSVGTPFNNMMTRPYDPSDPLASFKGTGIDPDTVVAPVTGSQSAFGRLSDKLKSVFGVTKPTPPRKMVTPGIFRRNRERAEERMWQRD